MPMTNAEKLKKQRAKRRDAGLCYHCPAPAEPGKTRCRRHLRYHNDLRSVPGGYTDQRMTRAMEHPERAPDDILVRELDRLRKDLSREQQRTEQVVQTALAAVSKLKFIKVRQPKVSVRGVKCEQDMHVLRSDAQVGEHIDPRGTSGLGKYDYQTYRQRLGVLLDKVLTFWEQDHRSLGLRRLVSPQLGDHVQGENVFRGAAYHQDRVAVDQIFDSLRDELELFWLPICQVFERVELFCVWGNHGRIGRPGEYAARTNFDYIYYRILKEALERSAPHARVYVSDSPVMLVQHGEKLFVYKHGDDVKGWMGLPYYGLDRSLRRTSRMFNKVIDYVCVGHFHSPANLNDETIVNGCMPGGSDLSINRMGLTSVPSQALFYFDKRYGINRFSNLYLAEKVCLTPDQRGIFTPLSP